MIKVCLFHIENEGLLKEKCHLLNSGKLMFIYICKHVQRAPICTYIYVCIYICILAFKCVYKHETNILISLMHAITYIYRYVVNFIVAYLNRS